MARSLYHSTKLTIASFSLHFVVRSGCIHTYCYPLIDTFTPMLIETHKAANMFKTGKAPGSCGVYPDYILHGGTDALRTLHSIFTHVWEDEVIPEEWQQGIVITLYKGKGFTLNCSNYRGIILLLVPVLREGVCTSS